MSSIFKIKQIYFYFNVYFNVITLKYILTENTNGKIDFMTII